MINIAVAGISGRMGLSVAHEVALDPECNLSVVTSRNAEAVCGTHKAVQKLQPNFDVLIDFTLPISAIENLRFCVQHKKPIVIGGTGFNAEQLAEIGTASQFIPIFKSNNMSLGANACNFALQQICSILDESWEILIEESHHKTKLDKPSGTALMLAQTVQEKNPLLAQKLTINSIRDEQTIGVHKIILKHALETIELTHTAFSREVFSRGAIAAAKWLAQQVAADLYSMHNML